MSSKEIVNEALIQEIAIEVENEQGISGISGDTIYFDFILEVIKKVNQRRQEVLPDSERLKMFVWTSVLRCCARGDIFALAHTLEEAQQVLERDKEDWMDIDEIYKKSPEVVDIIYGEANKFV